MAGELAELALRFATGGTLRAVTPFAGGHINDSYIVTCDVTQTTQRFLLQRVNERVFQQPQQVMENVARITGHLRRKITQGAAPGWRPLELVATESGSAFTLADDGGVWRLYRFVEGTRVVQAVETAAQAETAGRAFGAFQRLLADYDGPRLHETIRGFHDTPARLAALERAIAADRCKRVAEVKGEIAFVRSRAADAGELARRQADGELPERIVHNDAKIANVLLDEHSGQAVCVVDLDTVMPGLALHDFGDMVRSMTCRAAEDEPDASTVSVEAELFAGLARGYLAEAGVFLTSAERELLLRAGWVITLEQAARFLADYLDGDCYYKTSRPAQNLDRTRTQIALVKSLEAQWSALEATISAI